MSFVLNGMSGKRYRKCECVCEEKEKGGREDAARDERGEDGSE